MENMWKSTRTGLWSIYNNTFCKFNLKWSTLRYQEAWNVGAQRAMRTRNFYKSKH